MSKVFPRTTIEGLSLPRMIMGSNWILGYSHRSSVHDEFIVRSHSYSKSISAIAEAYLEYGVDAIMIPLIKDKNADALFGGLADAESKTGKSITKIITPVINVDDNAAARKEAGDTIKKCASLGAKICMLHHSSAEELVNKNRQTIERLPDYLAMIRENGMIPGLSAHMPEIIVFSDQNEYDVQTYIQIYNCVGFLMQVEIEYINKVIWNAKKPVMTIKSMAAGRVTPFVGLNFSYATIRPQDMVVLGAFSPEEVHEDAEIALAAIERRRPDIEGRSSPNKTPIMA